MAGGGRLGHRWGGARGRRGRRRGGVVRIRPRWCPRRVVGIRAGRRSRGSGCGRGGSTRGGGTAVSKAVQELVERVARRGLLSLAIARRCLRQRLLPVGAGPAHLDAGARRRVVADRLSLLDDLANRHVGRDLLCDVVVVPLHRPVEELQGDVWLASVPVRRDAQDAACAGRHDRVARVEVRIDAHVGSSDLSRGGQRIDVLAGVRSGGGGRRGIGRSRGSRGRLSRRCRGRGRFDRGCGGRGRRLTFRAGQERQVQLPLMRGIGEEARRVNRPRGADLARAQAGVERSQLGDQIARGEVARPNRLAIDRHDADHLHGHRIGERRDLAQSDRVVRERGAQHGHQAGVGAAAGQESLRVGRGRHHAAANGLRARVGRGRARCRGRRDRRGRRRVVLRCCLWSGRVG